MNKVILVGRLTRDPEIRAFSNGNSVANFTVAVNRPFKNREGVVEADFIPVQVSGPQVSVVQRYVFKGNQIGVEGRMQVRSYDAQDGSKRYVTEVVADRIELMGSKNDNSSSNPVNAYVDTTSSVFVDQPNNDVGVDVSSDDPYKVFGNEVSLSDDDLPF